MEGLDAFDGAPSYGVTHPNGLDTFDARAFSNILAECIVAENKLQ